MSTIIPEHERGGDPSRWASAVACSAPVGWGILVVTKDGSVAAAACAALAGEHPTVYYTGRSARPAFAFANHFRAILCDATTDVAEFLLSGGQEGTRPPVALLDTGECDAPTRERLLGSGVLLIHPDDHARIRAFIHSRPARSADGAPATSRQEGRTSVRGMR
jgi:hypothetical protein